MRTPLAAIAAAFALAACGQAAAPTEAATDAATNATAAAAADAAPAADAAASTPAAPVAFDLALSGGKVRTPTEGRPTAGYLTIANQGAQAVTVTGATSAAFARIELHDHVMKDGMMSMVKLDAVPVPAGETVAFKPGGLHLMMFEPTGALKAGDEVAVALTLGDAGTANATLIVVDEVPGGHGGH